jgi:hypothetical protein
MTMSRATARQQNLAVRDRSQVLDDWITELEGQVSTLTEQLAASQALEQQDQGTIADLKSQLAAAQQALEDCEAGHDPPTKTLWGANVGGYASQGETQAAAWTRITAGFGQVNVIRWWVNVFFDWADLAATPYKDVAAVVPNLGSDLAGVLAGDHDADMLAICAQATRPTFLTFAHEPEDDGYVLADWQAAQVHLAGLKAMAGNPLVKFGPLLMGASYHPTRWAGTGPNPIPAAQWLDFDLTNCDFAGADLYQWGKADADADHAEAVIGPFRDLAIALGKKCVGGELGARRRLTVSDATRKRWLDETAAIVAANPDLFLAICYYENDHGAADKIPWCLLPPPGQDPNDPANSPAAVAAYRALCLA